MTHSPRLLLQALFQRSDALPSSNGCGAGGIAVSSEVDFTP
jgi:hypothetical protein